MLRLSVPRCEWKAFYSWYRWTYSHGNPQNAIVWLCQYHYKLDAPLFLWREMWAYLDIQKYKAAH